MKHEQLFLTLKTENDNIDKLVHYVYKLKIYMYALLTNIQNGIKKTLHNVNRVKPR